MRKLAPADFQHQGGKVYFIACENNSDNIEGKVQAAVLEARPISHDIAERLFPSI